MRSSTILFIGILVAGCTQVEYPQSFPIVFTEIGGRIDSTGAEFIGTVESLGANPVSKYGFVWDEKPEPTLQSSYVTMPDNIRKGKFSKMVNNDLYGNSIYYVRAFIQTNRQIVYGNEMQFKSKGSLGPEIVTFSPDGAIDGSEVTIRGRNFSARPQGNIVKIGDLACLVTSSSDSVLKVEAPVTNLIGDFQITIEVAGRSTVSEDMYSIHGPRIRSLSTATGRVGDLVFIDGEYFKTATSTKLYFGNPDRFLQTESDHYIISDSRIEAYVPDYPPGISNPSGVVRPQLYSQFNSAAKKFIFPQDFKIINSWKRISSQVPMGHGVGVSSALVDGHLYFINRTVVYEFIPESNTWIRKADFPGEARNEGTAIAVGGKLYYGFGEGSSEGGYFDDLWEFDPVTNSWKFIMNAPIAKRSRSAGFSFGNKVYIGFGFSRVNSSFVYHNDFWMFDPSTKSWSELPTPANAVNQLIKTASFQVGGKGFVIGLNFKENWQFDPLTSAWTRMKDFPGQGVGASTASIASGFVFSGSSQEASYELFEYDVNTDRWIKRQKFPSPGGARAYAFAGWQKGKLYFGGGLSGFRVSEGDCWELTLQ